MSCCGKIIHGASAIVQNRLGIGMTDEGTYKARLRVCWDCDRARPCLGLVGKKCECAACGCIITEKALRASESCPLGKWPQARPADPRSAESLAG